MSPRLILASASPTRRGVLSGAGLEFEVMAADIDEAAIRDEMRAAGQPVEEVAKCLAEQKATLISNREPGTLVIGADQMLECGGNWFEKPSDMDQAREHLRALRNRSHRLVSSVVVCRDGETIWHDQAIATLWMRDLSEAFLEAYLARAGRVVLGSVGAYLLEGLGAQLFERIEGDYFTVLGLPLLPLLGFLRQQGALQT